MKKVFVKKNNFMEYKLFNLEGYLFNPRNKNINSLKIIDDFFIKNILSKKIKRDITRVKRAINLIVNSDVTIISDCDMMISELIKLTKKLDKKYRIYFNEFEYFERVKDLYVLNHIIRYKRKVLESLND